MRRYLKITFSIISIIIAMSSCDGNAKKKISDAKNITDIETSIQIQETHFDSNWNKLHSKNKLTKTQYESLKLGNLSFMAAYGDLEYEIGSSLIDTDQKKLLSIKAVSSGEISEYLLGYIDNNVTDSLLIAYEDVVEYYSITSSIIESNKITVTTINYDYSGMEEISDTIVTKYNITPELTFEEIIEE